MRGNYRALMLFGSYARGDYEVDSDIDVLQVVDDVGLTSYGGGKIAFSVYDFDTLSRMAKQGEPFILHLKREGKLLEDPFHELGAVLAQFSAPKDVQIAARQMRIVAKLLDVSTDTYLHRWQQLHEVAIFIVRSIAFAKLAAQGTPCFSIKKASVLLSDEALRVAGSIHRSRVADLEGFRTCRAWIERELKAECCNECGTTEALLVKYEQERKLVQMGIRILSGGREILRY